MRSLFIAAALLLPIVVIALLSDKIKPAPAMYHHNESAAEITSKVRPAPRANNTLPERVPPGSLAEERQRLQKRLLELDKMTEPQWQEERKARQDFGRKWNGLSDEQKLKAMEKMREKKETGRVPEIEGTPASPPMP